MMRLTVAWVATVGAALFAGGLWAVGQAQYTEDYCHTRAPQPPSPHSEGLSGRPGYLDGPLTIRCEYDQVSAVEVTDPLPLVGAVVLTMMVIAVAVVALQWARQATGTQSPANDHRAVSRS
jgi:multisubunit Na+/H+ antiporter MnhC subunit